MPATPLVAYIEDDHGDFTNENHDRAALTYFLREMCGCEVALYDYVDYFKEDLPRLKKAADRLILVIVKQGHFDDHDEIITMVRRLSKKVPVVVIPQWNADEEFTGNPGALVYAFQHRDEGLIDLVRHLTAEWKPPLDWLGGETVTDKAIMASQLEQAYRVHHPGEDDEGSFAPQDPNGSVVAEALRIKLLGSQFVASEFDDTLRSGRGGKVFRPTTAYEEESARVRGMNETERRTLHDALLRARGREPMPGGGHIVLRASSGDNVAGFAIDPVTLETLTTSEFGLHHHVRAMLANRLERIEDYRTPGGAFMGECEHRIVTGLIFSKIPGFKTPLLQIHTNEGGEAVEEETLRKITRFLKKQRQFIPITSDGQLIEG